MKLSVKITAAALSAILALGAVSAVPAEMPNGFNVTASAAKKKLPATEKLTAKAGLTDVTLKWRKVSGAEGYRVYIFSDSEGAYIPYDDVTETTCNVTGLLVETRYRFRVAALVNGKAQTASDSVSVSTGKNSTLMEFDPPAFGTPFKEALTVSGLAKYYRSTNKKAGTSEYVGQSMYKGKKAKTYLYLSLDDTVCGYGFYITSSTYSFYKSIFDEYAEGGFRRTAGEADGSSKETKFTNNKIDVRILQAGNELLLMIEEKRLPATKDAYVNENGDGIRLSWKKIDGADGYRVYMRKKTADTFEKYADVKTAACIIDNMEKGVIYQFAVTALAEKNGEYREQLFMSDIYAKVE